MISKLLRIEKLISVVFLLNSWWTEQHYCNAIFVHAILSHVFVWRLCRLLLTHCPCKFEARLISSTLLTLFLTCWCFYVVDVPLRATRFCCCMFLCVWLQAPLSEEYAFRACMLPLLVPAVGEATAVLVCPLFFGVGESTNFISWHSSVLQCVISLDDDLWRRVYRCLVWWPEQHFWTLRNVLLHFPVSMRTTVMILSDEFAKKKKKKKKLCSLYSGKFLTAKKHQKNFADRNLTRITVESKKRKSLSVFRWFTITMVKITYSDQGQKCVR